MGCADAHARVVLLVPPSEEGTAPATWTIQLSQPLPPGGAVRVLSADQNAEYREGWPTPIFLSRSVDGVLKRISDDESGAPRYLIKAIARDPSIDTLDVGKRGVVGQFTVRDAVSCGP